MTRIPKGLAPDFTPGYPSKGKRQSQAWQYMWTELITHRGWHNGRALARECAMDYDLTTTTLTNMLALGAKYGLLEHRIEKADSGRGLRNTAFYRLNPRREVITDSSHSRPFASWERLS